jgi:peptide/nickel transport system ATP-binding protein
MTNLVELHDVCVDHPRGFGRSPARVLHNINLAIAPGETVGLVGESGSGKSTIGRVVLGLQPASAGTLLLEGRDVTRLERRARRHLARTATVQAVFQNPYSSLDPTRQVGASIAEPLEHAGPTLDKAARRRLVAEALEQVGLSPADARRYPSAFSGGQLQRIAIARAVIARPKLIVCDEAVSALDLSVQAQVLNLLADLQAEHGMAYLFVSHDLAVVRFLAHRVAVLSAGRLVETASVEDIYRNPTHPYTRQLLAASAAPQVAGDTTRPLSTTHTGGHP